jgi:DNA-binding response OmpR family regulator
MRRILIVEDDPVLRDTYQTILATQPYLCDVATNGKEALEKCQTHTYDLILLDLMMPVMSGIDFLENYKEIDAMKSKIIILSNLSSGKEIERAHEIGIVKSLVKSDLSPRQLIGAIRYDLETGQ